MQHYSAAVSSVVAEFVTVPAWIAAPASWRPISGHLV